MNVVQYYSTHVSSSSRNDDGQHRSDKNSVGTAAKTDTAVASSLSQRIELLDSETRCTTQGFVV